MNLVDGCIYLVPDGRMYKAQCLEDNSWLLRPHPEPALLPSGDGVPEFLQRGNSTLFVRDDGGLVQVIAKDALPRLHESELEKWHSKNTEGKSVVMMRLETKEISTGWTVENLKLVLW